MGFIKHADVPMKDVKVLTPEEAAAAVKTASMRPTPKSAAPNEGGVQVALVH